MVDPVDVSILLEGKEMFPGCGSTATADGAYLCPQPDIPPNTALHLWGVPETFPVFKAVSAGLCMCSSLMLVMPLLAAEV